MIYRLPAGHIITVTVTDGFGSIKQIEDATIGATFATSKTYGPYFVERSFAISNNATVAITAVSTSLLSMFDGGDGAPVSAAKATLTVNPAGDENGLTFTAKEYGSDGNLISIAYVDPAANDQPLTVSVVNSAITVSLKTGAAGAIESTAAEVLAAVNAAASKLVVASIYADDSGGADDGSGVVTAMAKASLTGGAGTNIGLSLPGAYYIDTTNGLTYTNTGTLAAPVWTASVTTAAYGVATGILNGLAAVFLYGDGAPVDYTDGDPPATGEGTAPKGALYCDISAGGSGFVYRNSGTQAQPTWTKLGDAGA
jgi:hypothetical protein